MLHLWSKIILLPHLTQLIFVSYPTILSSVPTPVINNDRSLKATKPFKGININFEGPLPSNNKNKYLFNVIDDYSRFLFVFFCSDVCAPSVIRCLSTLFSLFGMPIYVHSDRGALFMSQELREFLTSIGVATRLTSIYIPAGNGKVERYNGAIWKGIAMSLKSKNLPNESW